MSGIGQGGITKQNLGIQKQILFAPDMQVSVGVVVSNEGITADSAGKKIIKAGTPLVGSLDARNTPFKVATAETGSNVTCIALHDVDVTGGNANGVGLIFGFVNTNMLEASVKAALTATVKTALNKITFVAC